LFDAKHAASEGQEEHKREAQRGEPETTEDGAPPPRRAGRRRFSSTVDTWLVLR